MDLARPAGDVWTVKRKPVDIVGRLMIRVDFQLKGWEITVPHAMCGTVEEADAECHRIQQDIQHMLDGPFRAKYRIGHDLLGGL